MFKYKLTNPATNQSFVISSQRELTEEEIRDAAKRIFGIEEEYSIGQKVGAVGTSLYGGAKYHIQEFAKSVLGHNPNDPHSKIAEAEFKKAGGTLSKEAVERKKRRQEKEKDEALTTQLYGEIAREDYDKQRQKDAEIIGPFWSDALRVVGGVVPAVGATIALKDPKQAYALGATIGAMTEKGSKLTEYSNKELERLRKQNPNADEADLRVKAANNANTAATIQGLKTGAIIGAGGYAASKLGIFAIEGGRTSAQALVAAGVPKAGAGRVGRGVAKLSRGIADRGWGTRVLASSTLESFEEGLDELIGSGLDWSTGYSPEMTVGDALKNAGVGAAYGFILGGAFSVAEAVIDPISGADIKDARNDLLKNQLNDAGEAAVNKLLKSVNPKLEKSALEWARENLRNSAELNDNQILETKLKDIERDKQIRRIEDELDQIEDTGAAITDSEAFARRKFLRGRLQGIRDGEIEIQTPEVQAILDDLNVNTPEEAIAVLDKQAISSGKSESDANFLQRQLDVLAGKPQAEVAPDAPFEPDQRPEPFVAPPSREQDFGSEGGASQMRGVGVEDPNKKSDLPEKEFKEPLTKKGQQERGVIGDEPTVLSPDEPKKADLDKIFGLERQAEPKDSAFPYGASEIEVGKTYPETDPRAEGVEQQRSDRIGDVTRQADQAAGRTRAAEEAKSKQADLEGILSGQVEPEAEITSSSRSKAADVGKILTGPKKEPKLTSQEKTALKKKREGGGALQSAKEKLSLQSGLKKIQEKLRKAKGVVVKYGRSGGPAEMRQSGASPAQILQGAIETGILALKAGVSALDVADIMIKDIELSNLKAGTKITNADIDEALDKVGKWVAKTSSISVEERERARRRLEERGVSTSDVMSQEETEAIGKEEAFSPIEKIKELETKGTVRGSKKRKIVAVAKRSAKEYQKRLEASANARTTDERVKAGLAPIKIDGEEYLDTLTNQTTDEALVPAIDFLLSGQGNFEAAVDAGWKSSRFKMLPIDEQVFKIALSKKLEMTVEAVADQRLSVEDAVTDVINSGTGVSLITAQKIADGNVNLEEGIDFDTASTGTGIMGFLKSLFQNNSDEAVRRGYNLIGKKVANQWIRNIRLAGKYESSIFSEFESPNEVLETTVGGITLGRIKSDISKEVSDYMKARAIAKGKGESAPDLAALSDSAQKLVRGIDRTFMMQGEDGKSAGVQQRDSKGNWSKGSFSIGEGGYYQILRQEFKVLIPHIKEGVLGKSNKTFSTREKEDLREFMQILGFGEDLSKMTDWVKRNYGDKEGKATKQSLNSSLEKRRENPLPVEALDFSPDAFLQNSKFWAKRLSEIENFGQSTDRQKDLFEEYSDLLSSSEKGAKYFSSADLKREREYLKDLREHIYETRERTNVLTRKVLPWVSSTTTYTLLSGITSSINNYGALGQIIASGAAQGSYSAPIKGALYFALPSKVAKMFGLDGMSDSMLREYGVINEQLNTIAQGYQETDPSSLSLAVNRMDKGQTGGARVSDIGVIATKPFSSSERGVRTIAAQAAHAYVRTVQDAYKRGVDPKLVKAFRDYVKSLGDGIDADGVLSGDNNAEADFIVRVVSENVGSFKVQQMPRWTSTAGGQFFSKFLPYVLFMNQSAGHTVKLAKNSKSAGASVGMVAYMLATHALSQELLAKLKEYLFGKERDVASVTEILNSPADQAFGKAAERLTMDLTRAGSLGLIGYAYEQYYYASKYSESGTPSVADTPNLALIKNVFDSFTNPYNVGIKEKSLDFANKSITAVRDAGNLFKRFSPEEYEFARVAMLKEKNKKLRRAARRFGDEFGIDPSSGGGEPSKMFPYYRDVKNRLYLGDVEGARAAAIESSENSSSRDRSWASLNQSILSGQPMKVGNKYGSETQEAFMNWAARTLSDEDFADIMEVHSVYRTTALEAGLISAGDEDGRYEETRNLMKEVMNQKPVEEKKRKLIPTSRNRMIMEYRRSMMGGR